MPSRRPPDFRLPAQLARRRVPGCEDVAYLEDFLEPDTADAAFAEVLRSARWRRECIALFGRDYDAPRLTDWAGDAGLSYRYSRVDHPCSGWPDALDALRQRVAGLLAWRFDFVLLNRYRDGRDAMGWHADDEAELGPCPVIASLSLGARRRFRLRHRATGRAVAIDLEHGSLLVMKGRSQHDWLHALPRTARSDVGERINLTFRRLDHA